MTKAEETKISPIYIKVEKCIESLTNLSQVPACYKLLAYYKRIPAPIHSYSILLNKLKEVEIKLSLSTLND